MQSVAQRLSSGLDAFAVQFRAQLLNGEAPSSEHAIHFCLALGFQAAYDLPAGSIVFERRTSNGRRIDLWVERFGLAIEVKFRRRILSGRSQPTTQHYGDLLADFSKVAAYPADARLVLLVADGPGFDALRRSTRLLPLAAGEPKTIAPEDITGLPATAARRAVSDGPWVALTATLAWIEQCDDWRLLAWFVQPI